MRRWKDAWNKGGYEGLKPNFTGGYKPMISSSVWDEIIEEIKDKAMTLRDVQVYVNTKYGVDYAYHGVWHLGKGEEKSSVWQTLSKRYKKTRGCRGDFKKNLKKPSVILKRGQSLVSAMRVPFVPA